MKVPTMLGSRIRKFYQIRILTSFCNQKRYFAFLSFYVDKMVMKQKYQMKLPIIPGSWIRKFYGIGFSTSFCNQKRYFAFFSFWLDKMVMTKKQQMKPHKIQGSRLRKSCWIDFFTPFCNQTVFFVFQLLALYIRSWCLIGQVVEGYVEFLCLLDSTSWH